MRRVLAGLFAGFISGMLFLGLGGRFVMRLLALLADHPTDFGLGPSLALLLAGAILGIVASLGYTLGGRAIPGTPALKGALYGTLFFVVLVAVLLLLQPALIREEIVAFPVNLILVTLLFWSTFVGYGMVLAKLMARQETRVPDVPPIVALGKA